MNHSLLQESFPLPNPSAQVHTPFSPLKPPYYLHNPRRDKSNVHYQYSDEVLKRQAVADPTRVYNTRRTRRLGCVQCEWCSHLGLYLKSLGPSYHHRRNLHNQQLHTLPRCANRASTPGILKLLRVDCHRFVSSKFGISQDHRDRMWSNDTYRETSLPEREVISSDLKTASPTKNSCPYDQHSRKCETLPFEFQMLRPSTWQLFTRWELQIAQGIYLG
jgi:hypothetical protein